MDFSTMTYDWPLYICLFLAIWSAIIGGVFSAFSEFIMSALLRAAPPSGIETMQQINRTVIKTQFVAGLILIAPLSLIMAVFGWLSFEGAARGFLLLAPIVYLPSVFLMTVLGNVPMNNKLDQLDHRDPGAQAYWARYGRVWTRLNHVRTLGSLISAVIYIGASLALISSGQV